MHKPKKSGDTSIPLRRVTQKPNITGRVKTALVNASVYAEKFAGKKMADGTKMNPRSDNAASKTLPLGTTAKVTNLQTGQSAKVTIRDRGPYVKGRILDVSPSTARTIGITKNKGVARVHVIPIAAPKANDGVKSSTAAHKVKVKKTASTVQGK
jgi:rare lipoprotein A